MMNMASFLWSKLIRPAALFCSFILIFGTLTRAQSLPALYVFGDSIVDVGNNNYLSRSLLKANFLPNGIDFPGRKPTGRFSNGKNAADFLAEKVGLPTAPAYLSQPNSTFMKGVNFASGGAGVFNTTLTGILMRVVPLDKQVEYFSSVGQRVLKEKGSNTAAQEHFSKSLICISIGSNDIIDYFNNKTRKNTPQQYVTLMITTLKQQIKGIYGAGGRKFFIIGLPPIGCAPMQRHRNAANECMDEVNIWTKKYNDQLAQLLPQLQSELKGFHYSFFDSYTLFFDFIKNPKTYGFSEVKAACCGLGKLRAAFYCTPVSRYCSDRNAHIFWDVYHPSEASAQIFMNTVFNGSATYASPINLQQLISL